MIRFLLCLVFVLVGCAPEATRIRVMTYNIHHGADAEERPSLGEVAELIAELQVDVVGLQEVDRHWAERSGFADQVNELADRLGMHSAFGPIYDLPPEENRSERRRYGLAILSRHPIVDTQNFELTRLPSIGEQPERRRMPGFLMAAIDVNGTVLHVFNTHLDYRSDPAVRTTQVEEMLDILSSYPAPLVLLGDFNALPDADELEPLYDAYIDAWDVAGQGDGRTYPAVEPVKRIDMVFVTADVHVDSVAVHASAASDHRPVTADFTIEPGR